MGVHQESDVPPIALINHNWALAHIAYCSYKSYCFLTSYISLSESCLIFGMKVVGCKGRLDRLNSKDKAHRGLMGRLKDSKRTG